MEPPEAPKLPFQLQILPGDPRRRTRQLRLSRRSARLVLTLAVLAASPAVAGWIVAPWLLYTRFSHRDVRVQVARRAQQGERLQQLVEQIGLLGEQAAMLERRTAKMRLLLELGGPPATTPAAAAAGEEVPGPLAGAVRRGLGLLEATEERFARIGATLESVETFTRTNPAALGTVPSVFPLGAAESVLVAGFGPRRNPYTQEVDFHSGIDVAAPLGTPVRASAEGQVVFAGVFDRREGGWWRLGRVVAVRNGERYLTIFGHCEALSVKVGQRVARGQAIATVGNTGWSTTVHLHYEVRRLGGDGTWRAVDPRLYILDQSWEDEERLLAESVNRRQTGGEPLPRLLTR